MWLGSVSKRTLVYTFCCSCSFFCTNILFILLGLILIIIGAWSVSDEILRLAGETGTLGFLISGIFIVVVSAFGIYGGYQRTKTNRILTIFAVLMSSLVVAQIILGSIIISNGGSLSSSDLLQEGWNHSDNSFKIAWENRLDCCGFSVFNVSAGQPCPIGATKPCIGPLHSKYSSVMIMVSSVGIVFGCLEVFGIITAVAVIRNTKSVHDPEPGTSFTFPSEDDEQ